jgi:hypothetical protein
LKDPTSRSGNGDLDLRKLLDNVLKEIFNHIVHNATLHGNRLEDDEKITCYVHCSSYSLLSVTVT